jgi:hypothetical protein
MGVMVVLLLFAVFSAPSSPLVRVAFERTPPHLQDFSVQKVEGFSNGLEVFFTKPLMRGVGSSSEDYSLLVAEGEEGGASRWKEIPILSALVSGDRRSVFLATEDLRRYARFEMRLEFSRAIFSEDLSPLAERKVEISKGVSLRTPKSVALPLSSPNVLTEEEKREGFRLLFDGQTFSGWRGFRRDTIPATWSVQNGTMAVTPGSGGGDIITTEEFGNFELRLQWKISPRGNSGIFFRVSEQGRFVWETGPEMQILDDEGYGEGLDPKTSAGADYALYAPARRVTRAVGKWNDVRIIVKGAHVEYWLNGHKVVEYELGSEDWLNRVKASKFASLPHFGRMPKGHIALQDHGFPVWFRNVRVRDL